MKIFELITQLNNMYSFNLAEDYDNIGLLIGDENLEVKKVFTSLDIDFEICMEAVDNGCNVIVSHHPLFAFDPLKKIDYNLYSGKLVKFIVENNLNIIAMHTNVDNMNASVSKWIAEDLGFETINYFSVENEKSIGVVCSVDLKYHELLESLDNKYGSVNYIGDPRKRVSKIAIVGGSGSFLLDDFGSSDIDVFITGDIKYHDFHDMYKLDKCVVDIGHFAENVFINKVLNNIDVNYYSSKRTSIIKKTGGNYEC
ncbi:MAG: Nif3-like dinuclear metal center hexameric protein [Bacilli bacterium]